MARRLVCVLLGDGAVITVRIHLGEIVGDLKYAIKKQAPSIPAEAHELQLFLARKKVGEGDVWLESTDPLVSQLRRGEIPQEVVRLYLKDEIGDPANALSSIFPQSFPKTETIHVLVKVSVKRRRLENAQLLTEVPHISIQDVEYVTLPGEFVAKCGLYPGGDLMLYCRPQVYDLWAFLRDEVIAKDRRGWIVGPPGTGKSACTLSFAASLDPEEWNVVWIHIGRKVTSCCVVTGSKQYCEIGDLMKFELPRVNDMKLFVCIDGFNEEVSKTSFLPKIGASLHKADRLVICSSMATVGKTNGDDEERFRVSYFFMYSWTQEEYIKAIADPTFYEKVAPKLDTTSDWEVNDNNDNDDEGQLSDDAKKIWALQRKFYYAGGSCRFMFQYSTSQVEDTLRQAVNSVPNKVDLVRYCTGVIHPDSPHALYGMQRDTLADAGRYPVSSFAAALCAQECGEDVISKLASRLNKSSNPRYPSKSELVAARRLEPGRLRRGVLPTRKRIKSSSSS